MLQVCKSNEEPIFEWVWDQIDTAVSGAYFVLVNIRLSLCNEDKDR